ncbi:RNA polymerase sigma-70 factor [Gordonia soli]|uniref:Putative RNA polymerase ECF-type sigma factor n=1 Tax=Gordonia soli NBRC 108243 TaxID=1223545 RepID=M0QRB7_9ACTN|nr:RNA polymerase sigma-70 factor [Gordonia soli]GAC70022.1 putative RNA polymerase ECF-type sigma factor [Gordonia soli NBRC 108243]
MTVGEAHARQFTELRPLLFTVAYEILGSASEAEDVLQESYLRWAGVDLAGVDDPRAYLATVVTRQSLNTLRAAARRREQYVGPWLPEPILLAPDDPARDAELAESVSTALLLVLETLGPDERAVFVLREVFGFEHSEIATIVGKSSAAVRQIAHRAREHVHARRRRFDPVDADRAATITTEFLTAAATGDLEGLMTMLAPDVVYTADSDGKASAARRPVRGAQNVGKLFVGMVRLMTQGEIRLEPRMFNGSAGVVLYLDDRVEGVLITDVVGDRIAAIYVMRNPDKLAGIDTPRRIGR